MIVERPRLDADSPDDDNGLAVGQPERPACAVAGSVRVVVYARTELQLSLVQRAAALLDDRTITLIKHRGHHKELAVTEYLQERPRILGDNQGVPVRIRDTDESAPDCRAREVG